jgi:hypothetical protein
MRSLIAGVLLLTGCGSSSQGVMPSANADAGAPDLEPPDLAMGGRPPSDHPQMALLKNNGGPTLKNAEVWTVVWKGDEALGADVDRFTAWMLTSQYWTDSLGEYGIGAGVAKGVIVLPDAPPATYDSANIPTLIGSLTAQAKYTPNANTLFQIVLSSSTTLYQSGGKFCDVGGGYHVSTADGVPYSVIPQCPGADLHLVLSHETAEAATDPQNVVHAGWQSADPPGEVADLCSLPTEIQAAVADADGGVGERTYTVTRLLSNKAVMDGNREPCVPAPATPYFGVAPLPGMLTITTDDAGGTADFELHPFAYGPVGPIKWALYSIGGATFEPAQGTAQAGDTVHVTVKVGADAGQLYGGVLPIYVYGVAGSAQTLWTGSITIQ